MSIRKGKTIIAGNAVSSDWIGTLEEYNIALKNGTIKENWVCYITDDEQGYISSKYGSDIALLDIIVSNQLLEGKDLIGKALQGSMVLGSEYPDAYNKLLTNKNKSASTQVTETIGGIELTYTQCAIGYKILDISNKDKYDQLFETTGTSNFFVLDETNKLFYLPKTNNFLQPNTSVGEIGNYNEAGLPNIEGSARRIACTTEMETDGALSFETDGTNNTTAGASLSAKINFDASKSNPIYGNSSTVQPQSTNVFIYYKVGNTIQTDASIDLEAQVLNLQQRNNIPFSLLESKYSETPLNNTSWLLSNGQWNDGTIYEAVYDRLINLQENTQESISVKLHTDSYTDYDFVLNLEDKTFRLPLLNGSEDIIDTSRYIDYPVNSDFNIAPANGYVFVETDTGVADNNVGIYVKDVNDQTVYIQRWQANTAGMNQGLLVPITKGFKFGFNYATVGETPHYRFYYNKGNGSLYFYVGETNTDINVINTGKLAEKYSKDIDNKLDKSQITNCITKIPQRIKYTLENDTLTIKAGSVVIVPYGTEDLTANYPVGSTFLNDNFRVYDAQFAGSKFFVWVELVEDIISQQTTTTAGTVRIMSIAIQGSIYENAVVANAYSISATVLPDDSKSYQWYQTDINKCVHVNSSHEFNSIVVSFPFGLCISSDTSYFGSIKQIFNGMGYIGSTVWADKGVKGLIPNGRNEDGTLKNIEVITDKVSIRNVAEGDKNISITISTDSIIGDYFSLINTDTPPAQTYKLYYKEKENELWNTYNNSPARFLAFICANATMTRSEGITSFNPKTPFRAVDYNDFANTPHITETYVNGTSGYNIWSNGYCEQWGRITSTGTSISLLKSFQNTNYNVSMAQKGAASGSIARVSIEGLSTSTITIAGTDSKNLPAYWRACGYIN